MKLKLDRIISIATLVALIGIMVVLLKRPAPAPQGTQVSAGSAANATSSNPQPFHQNTDRLEPAATQARPAQQSPGSVGYAALAPSVQNLPATGPKPEAHSNSNSSSNSDAIGAAVNHLLGASAGVAAANPDSEVGTGSPNIKDQKITYDGDMVHGQFLTEIGGRDVWVTISGRMGQKDGYATFDPTEFKVGDVDVPVSLVNPALQKKLAEERDRLKLDPADAK